MSKEQDAGRTVARTSGAPARISANDWPEEARKAYWRELPPTEMAAHLLATPTISDRAWTSEPRLPRENRSDFVRRVLLGEILESEPVTLWAEPDQPKSEPEAPAVEAAELAAKKPGYHLLNTDGGNLRRLPGEPLTHAAIGALLRTRRLVHVDKISKAIGPATHNVAEYEALIAGLELARAHGIEHIRVYTDSELVVDQVNGFSAVKQAHLQELHEQACGLLREFKTFRIGWVPRDWNLEADQLVRDALSAL